MWFEFDPAKAATNLSKHGVSFADAEALFEDPSDIRATCNAARGKGI